MKFCFVISILFTSSLWRFTILSDVRWSSIKEWCHWHLWAAAVHGRTGVSPHHLIF